MELFILKTLLFMLLTTMETLSFHLKNPVAPLSVQPRAIFPGSFSGGNVLSKPTVADTRLFNWFQDLTAPASPLGQGITVAKVLVTVSGGPSVLKTVSRLSSSPTQSPSQLSSFLSRVCGELLKREDNWEGGCIEAKYFGGGEGGGREAERAFNKWSSQMGTKFDLVENAGATGKPPITGSSQAAIIGIVLELQGQETVEKGVSGTSITSLREALLGISADCRVEGGRCLNAAEVFWCGEEGGGGFDGEEIWRSFPEVIRL